MREDEWRALIQLPTSLMAIVFVVVFATQSPTNQHIYIIFILNKNKSLLMFFFRNRNTRTIKRTPSPTAQRVDVREPSRRRPFHCHQTQTLHCCRAALARKMLQPLRCHSFCIYIVEIKFFILVTITSWKFKNYFFKNFFVFTVQITKRRELFVIYKLSMQQWHALVHH